MALISVIIPTYNRIDIVGYAIASALNQTYPEVEVIVVDDGSTDGTADAVKARFGDRIRYQWKENGGVSSARNLGIRLSSGSMIAFLDSDDEWLPEKLEKQARYLLERADFGMVLCDCTFIDSERNPVMRSQRRKHLPRDGYIVDDVIMSPSLIPSSVLVKKEVLDQVGGFDEEIRTAEDLDLHLRIASRYKIGLLAEPLFNCMAGHAGLSMESRTYDDHVFVIERFVKSGPGQIQTPHREPLFTTYVAAANGKFWLREWRSGIGYGWKATRTVNSFQDLLTVSALWVKCLRYLYNGIRARRDRIEGGP